MSGSDSQEFGFYSLIGTVGDTWNFVCAASPTGQSVVKAVEDQWRTGTAWWTWKAVAGAISRGNNSVSSALVGCSIVLDARNGESHP